MAELRKSTYIKKSQAKAINEHIKLFELDIELIEEKSEYLMNITSDTNASRIIEYFKEYDGSMKDFYERSGLI